MTLWIDGDSCHRKAMDIAFRAVGRKGLAVTAVADRPIPGAVEAGVNLIILPHGSGETDNRLADDSLPGDIAVTRDLALVMRLLENGLTVMNDRGRVWSMKEINARIREAELMQAMKAGGMVRKSISDYDADDARRFAASLDQVLNGHAHRGS